MPVAQCSGVGAVAYVGGAGAGLYIAMVYLAQGMRAGTWCGVETVLYVSCSVAVV